MGTKNPDQEVEIKLRVADVAALQNRLKRLRARESCPRTYEFNTLYDTAKNDLARRNQLIRIRMELPASHRRRTRRMDEARFTLTYKGPAQSWRGARTTAGKMKNAARYKIRAETEVAVANGEQMRLILIALRLRPSFRYEKFRTTYALPGTSDVKIELDETPVGTFLELEGTPSAIDRAAKRLGYTCAEYITTTYGALYIANCRLRGQKPADMLFASK
jgi:adenylate cyclase class 2